MNGFTIPTRSAGLALGAMLFSLTWLPYAAGGAEPFLPRLMPADLETELALSAAPAGHRAGATVYILRRGGYDKVREGSNHYSCFVVRTVARFDVQSPDTLIPICFDEEGMRAIAPMHFDSAKFREQGIAFADIRSRIKAGFADGRYSAPSRPGISYMISPVLNLPDGKGGVWNYPPHFMFYAPGLTNEEQGTAPDRGSGWLPWVNNSGPHGMIIMPVGKAEQEAIRGDSQNSACFDIAPWAT